MTKSVLCRETLYLCSHVTFSSGLKTLKDNKEENKKALSSFAFEVPRAFKMVELVGIEPTTPRLPA